MALTENDIMPFGAHKGKKIANVPDYYLKWLYEQINEKSRIHWTLTDKLLHKYITENKKTIIKENQHYVSSSLRIINE